MERYIILPSERIRDFFLVCVLRTSGHFFFKQMFGQRRISQLRVNAVALEWVGASHERAPFWFYDAVIGVVDRCLPSARNLAASN